MKMVREDCKFKTFKLKKICSCGRYKKIYKCGLIQLLVTDNICMHCDKYESSDKNE